MKSDFAKISTDIFNHRTRIPPPRPLAFFNLTFISCTRGGFLPEFNVIQSHKHDALLFARGSNGAFRECKLHSLFHSCSSLLACH